MQQHTEPKTGKFSEYSRLNKHSYIYIYIRLYTHRDTNFIKDQERLINTSEDLNSFLIRNQ